MRTCVAPGRCLATRRCGFGKAQSSEDNADGFRDSEKNPKSKVQSPKSVFSSPSGGACYINFRKTDFGLWTLDFGLSLSKNTARRDSRRLSSGGSGDHGYAY